jgi:predicted RNase H-like HicB family nuclease
MNGITVAARRARGGECDCAGVAQGKDNMDKAKFTYWQDDDMWLGYLEDYPNYMTQGETLIELEENLKDIFKELTSGNIRQVRKVAELELA